VSSGTLIPTILYHADVDKIQYGAMAAKADVVLAADVLCVVFNAFLVFLRTFNDCVFISLC